jgi:hypothetical protein
VSGTVETKFIFRIGLTYGSMKEGQKQPRIKLVKVVREFPELRLFYVFCSQKVETL